MLWRTERESEKLIGDANVKTVRYKAQLTAGKPDKISKTPQMINTIRKLQFSATSLDAYLMCGLKFYYSSVLRLREKPEVDEEIDPRDIGDVVHRILHEIVRPMMNTRMTTAALDAIDLIPIIEEQFRRYFGAARGAREFLLQGQILKQMQAFIEHYQIPLIRQEQIVLLGAEDELQASIGMYRSECAQTALKNAVIKLQYSIIKFPTSPTGTALSSQNCRRKTGQHGRKQSDRPASALYYDLFDIAKHTAGKNLCRLFAIGQTYNRCGYRIPALYR